MSSPRRLATGELREEIKRETGGQCCEPRTLTRSIDELERDGKLFVQRIASSGRTVDINDVPVIVAYLRQTKRINSEVSTCK